MATLDNLLPLARGALGAAEGLYGAARASVRGIATTDDGKIDAKALDREQTAAHGLAWLATYVEALRQMLGWAERLESAGRLGELEALILQAAYGEYLAQIAGGIPMSQGEIVRPYDMGVDDASLHAFYTPEVSALLKDGHSAAVRDTIAHLVAEAADAGSFGDAGLEDDDVMIRDQFRRFAEDKVTLYAHDWHLKDELIPLSVIEELAGMGVFGLTVPEEVGGLGMHKTAMCLVTEELSRAYIGVGSLGTRTEIAAELVMHGGTAAQKEAWLPRIVSGDIIPTAVFTEPGTGSDLGSLRTRAQRDGDTYRVTGNKTWITHAARADLMTLLARTNPDEKGYRGLSMFLAEKPAGTDDDPFPADGHDRRRDRGARLPRHEGVRDRLRRVRGGRRLTCWAAKRARVSSSSWQTFESARIQTAARAVGVAQNGDGARLELCPRAPAVRQAPSSPSRVSATNSRGWRSRS